MSLGTWFRDYVYIPLGGNRVSKGRWVLNILAVWMLTGLWHGAAWNFVIWGLLFAVLLLIEKWTQMDQLPTFLRRVYVLFVVMISFVIFNGDNMAQAWQDILGLFGPLVTTETMYYLKSYGLLLALGCVGATPVIRNAAVFVTEKWKVSPVLKLAAGLALLLVCTGYLVDGSFNPFLYFRF